MKLLKKRYTFNDVTPFISIRHMLDMAKREAGENTAFRFKKLEADYEVSYNGFYNDVYALGAGLAKLGVSADHAACISENRYAWINTFLTMLVSPGVFVPVDNELTGTELISVLEHCDARVVFYSRSHEEFLKTNREKLPNIKYFIGFDRLENENEFISFDLLRIEGEALINDGFTDFETQKRKINDTAMIAYTAGTTGKPKGVMLSEKNLITNIYHGMRYCAVYQTSLAILPFHHIYEAVCDILGSIHGHATLCISSNVQDLFRDMQYYKPTHIYMVPLYIDSLYRIIKNRTIDKGNTVAFNSLIKLSKGVRKCGIDIQKTFFLDIHRVFGGKLKKIICGGAPLSPKIGDFFAAMGIKIINGYGITECSPIVSVNLDCFNNHRTVGIPLSCFQVMIDSPDEEGNGEILVKGPAVMKGYYKDPDTTKAVLSDDGWFSTGDYGHINGRKQLLITGRKNNMIALSNGKNVYPEELEGYISSIPYVKEVAVYGIKNESGNPAALCAEVFMDPESKTDFDTLAEKLADDIAHILKRKPKYKQIASVVVRAQEFPKTSANKIKRDYLGL